MLACCGGLFWFTLVYVYFSGLENYHFSLLLLLLPGLRTFNQFWHTSFKCLYNRYGILVSRSPRYFINANSSSNSIIIMVLSNFTTALCKKAVPFSDQGTSIHFHLKVITLCIEAESMCHSALYINLISTM